MMIKEKDLPEGWRIVKLKDVCELKKGKKVKITDTPNEKSIPYIVIENLRGEPIKNFTNDTNGLLCDSDDILLVWDGANCGTVGTGLKGFVGSTIARLRLVDDSVDKDYVYKFLRSKFEYLNSHITGATIPHLEKKSVINLKVPLPSLPTQKKIVSILEKAEKLKELRKKADKLTDDYLKSVFLEMFGDPGRNEKGWETKNFLEIFNITTGKLNSNAAVESGKYPFFTCSKNTFRIDRYSFDCEALLLSGNNASGEYSVKHYNGKFDAYQRTYVLTFKNAENSYRFFHFLLEKKLEELRSRSIGTNTKYLTLGILKWINLIVPPIELQNKFAEIVKQVEKMKEYQKKSQQQIEDLFNALMQKAFRGELVC